MNPKVLGHRSFSYSADVENIAWLRNVPTFQQFTKAVSENSCVAGRITVCVCVRARAGTLRFVCSCVCREVENDYFNV